MPAYRPREDARTALVARALVLLLLAGMLSPRLGAAQASVLVDASHATLSADLDWLAAQGFLQDHADGQQTLSRMEAAALVREAAARLAEHDRGRGAGVRPTFLETADAVVLRLTDRLAPELRRLEEGPAAGAARVGPWVAELRGGYFQHADRAHPNNFLGDVDARAQPLAGVRQGRALVEGMNAAVEVGGSFVVGPLAAHARGGFLGRERPGGEGMEWSERLNEAYVRVSAASVAVLAGRSNVVWGQSRRAGLLMSGNAGAPWMVRAHTDGVVRLPAFLGALGPVTGDIFLADLGEEQNFPSAKLLGYHVSVRPHPRVEVGMGLLSHFGGEGAPEYSLGWVIKELAFGLAGGQFSNKLGGFDFRLRFPEHAGLSLYGEIVADDLDTNPQRLPEWVREDVGHIYGIELARLTPDGRVGAWGEFHHTGHRYYRHTQFTSGMTYRRDFLGDPLGPDGDGVYGGVDVRLAGDQRVELEAGWERRSRDKYWVEGAEDIFNTFPGDDGWSIYEDFPEEKRLRATATWWWMGGAGLEGMVRAGVEQVTAFAWEAASDRTDALVEIRLTARVP